VIRTYGFVYAATRRSGSGVAFREVQGFTAAEVDRARRYHRPLYAALVVDAALGFGVLGVLAFSRLGEELYDPVEAWPWPLRTVAYEALAVAVRALVRLPVRSWRVYV